MVRFATEQDLDRVNELRKQVNDIHTQGRPDIFRAGFSKELQEFARQLLKGENSDIIVAERDGVICGMACVDYVNKPESPYSLARSYYHVQEIAVDEAFRRQGVGQELMTFMKQHARKKNLPKIELDMWSFNESAGEFYEAAGFLETRRWLELSVENELQERFEFRSIRPEEADQAVAIEQICFPPHEACSEKNMKTRIQKAPELFLVAVDKETGLLAGFLNGLSTNEDVFRDEFFTDADLYNPQGKNVMLLGLDVLPEYRRQGLAREIIQQYRSRERKNNRETLILTCLDAKVEMYKKLGFYDNGIANSSWGGEKWHEMSCPVE